MQSWVLTPTMLPSPHQGSVAVFRVPREGDTAVPHRDPRCSGTKKALAIPTHEYVLSATRPAKVLRNSRTAGDTQPSWGGDFLGQEHQTPPRAGWNPTEQDN